MKKVIKLTVLSAVSIATILTPLETAFADMQFSYGDNLTKRMREMRRNMDSQIEDMRKRMDANFHPRTFSTYPSLEKHHHRIHTSHHHPHHHVEHTRREQTHYHIERKTHSYVERKKTTHRHIHEYITPNIFGDTLTAGIIGLAAGAILGNIFKQPKQQPQVVYQAVPQGQVMYQQVPQKQVIYEMQSKTTYQPLHEPWTHDWLQYCKKKYRSFNSKTGTFRGYDGLNHFCYAPLN
ncbi:BA14K family protein [Bartonella raoultii]|uniref:Lectin-like protein BA14k n=1 Tax=Bartonella raoultii TaxID=1457020 RepID=A0ABS7I694_9HYPH|nr:BA14K family protein [Bartonella raoultii]MBX4335093.1 BA14K family protein [Bartonella raoultii]